MCFIAPWIPVYGVVSMLKKIRALLQKEAIGVLGPAGGIQMTGPWVII